MNNTRYCVYLALFIYISVPLKIFAQVTYNKRSGSPVGVAPEPGNLSNMAGLDYVDLATGTLKVGIPLYEIRVKDIVVPITLNYSALGIKASQEAGCVGMGWELSAGGSISTQVNGIPDYDPKGLFYNTNNPMLQLSPNGRLDVDNLINDRSFAVQVLNNEKDGAWDYYSYSTPNGGGKFMRTKGNLLTFPYNPLFTLTDKGLTTGDGLFYQFTPGDKRKVRKRTFYTKNFTPQYTTDWTQDYEPYTSTENLSIITSSRHRDTVSFSYEYFSSQGLPFPKVTTTMSVPLIRQVIFNSLLDIWQENPKYIIKEATYSQTEESFTTSTRLKDIYFPGGRVVFEYGPDYKGRDVLDRIIVQQKTDSSYSILKSFEFSYMKGFSHYLNGLYVKDKNNQIIQSWNFEYNEFLPVDHAIGTTETTAQDRWGFYNGKTDNQTLVEDPQTILSLQTKQHYPIYNVGSSSSGYHTIPKTSQEAVLLYGIGVDNLKFADREYVFSEAIKGTLKSIRTPMGDKVEYEYEPHKFYHNVAGSSDASSGIKSGGGIRIKAIIHRNSTGNIPLLYKEYKYGMNGLSETYSLSDLESGYGMVAYPENVTVTKGIYSTTGNPTAKVIQNLSVVSHAINDMSYSGGSYGIYPNVTEYIVKDHNATDRAQRYSGRTVHIFHGPDRNQLQTQENNNPAQDLNIKLLTINSGAENDNLYGKPIWVSKMRVNPNGHDPVERHRYSYQKFNAPDPSNPENSYSYFGGISGVRAGHYTTSSFQFCRTVYNPQSNTYITDCDVITLDELSQVDPLYFANIEYESTGSYYPGKYDGNVVQLHQYSDSWQLTSDIADYYGDSYQGTTGDTTVYTYNPQLQKSIIARKSKSKIAAQRITYPLDYTSSAISMGINDLKAMYMYNQPVEQLATVMIAGNEYVVGGMLTSHSNNNGLVNEDFVYQLNTGGKPLPYNLFGGINDPGYEVRRYSEYDFKGNLKQFAEDGEPDRSLIWGYDGAYPVAQAVNASPSDIAYAGFESVDKGNWVYNGAATVLTDAPVGKSAYALETGSLSKSELNTGKSYVLAYWLKNGGGVTVSGGTVEASVIKQIMPGWKYTECKVSGTSAITISGSGYVDDVKLHPVDSQMSTYTYEPAVGLATSTDVNGKTTYYEYDNFQRLWQVKDEDRNILKRIEYNYGF